MREGGEAPGWSREESLLLRAVDDMLDGAEIRPETLEAMDGVFGDRQILDIVFSVGVYLMMSTLLKTLDVPLEAGFDDGTILAAGARAR